MAEPTKNASNEKQIKTEGDLNEIDRALELDDLRKLLNTPEGRRFVWRLMGHCKVFASVWSPSASIHYLSGKQDVGHFILGEVTAADEDSLFLMMRESRANKESRAALLNLLSEQGANDV